MKKLTLLLAVVFATGVAYAADAPAAAKPADKADAGAKTKAVAHSTHNVEAEIVSVDAAKNTVTVKTEKGDRLLGLDELERQNSL